MKSLRFLPTVCASVSAWAPTPMWMNVMDHNSMPVRFVWVQRGIATNLLKIIMMRSTILAKVQKYSIRSLRIPTSLCLFNIYLVSSQSTHTHTQSTSSYHVKGEWDKCYVAHWLHFAHWSHRTAATARRPLDRVETIMRILFHGISLSLSPSPSPSLSSSCELLISLIRCTQCDRTRSMHILLANYNTFGWPYNYDLIFYGMQFIIIQMNTECNGCRSH